VILLSFFCSLATFGSIPPTGGDFEPKVGNEPKNAAE
jgi:hypothetical protein